jgi:hypothetical protein
MNQETELDLYYGTKRVGHIGRAFCNDATWHGIFECELRSTDGALASRLTSYIGFSKEWNERLHKGLRADVSEFQHFHDVVTSGRWTVGAPAGNRARIADASGTATGTGFPPALSSRVSA